MEQSRLNLLPFKAVVERLDTYHAINMDESDAVNIGLMAWDKIGNKEVCRYRYATTIKDFKVILPCNVEYVEAVALDVTECCNAPGDLDVLIDELVHDTAVEWVHDLYPRGSFVKYVLTRQGDKYVLKFDVTDYPVEVLYVGIRADKDGLPYLNEKEAEAISYFIAHNYHYKRFAAGVGAGSQALMQMLYQQWDRLAADARVPYEFTQNEINRVLDAQQSWNRKMYGKSFKI